MGEELRITFTLGERDLRHFRRVARNARARVKLHGEGDLIAAASGVVERVQASSAPAYVQERIAVVAELIAMLEDEAWRVPPSVRPRVLTVLAYLLDPEDLIPDHLPGLGYLDDAIMIELLTRELTHELAGWRQFRRWVEGRERSPRDREERRKRLRAKVQSRVQRDAERRPGLW